VRREVVGGFLHPVYNLHFALTHRSSSDNPNFQNLPIRDPRQSKLIRKAFIPRSKEHMILEVDYGALEFRGAACFWRDPAMVEYACDETLDIHRDMAAECYRLDVDQVSKMARSMTKTMFVFPELYGSYYKNCARSLWSVIAQFHLKTVDGVGLYEELERQGIGTYDAFVEHIRRVEQHLNERFSYWSEQKEVWWNKYVEQGWFKMMTGFVCSGIYSRNQVMNSPIQGPSFHCLLWSLIQLNRELKHRKMKTVVAGQVHDSIWLDVYKPELDDVMQMAHEWMTIKVREHWDWIITDLEIEVEGSDQTWYDKQPIPFTGAGA